MSKQFTVKDLIDFLKTITQDLPVGVQGHFGEFNPMSLYDFRIVNATEKLSYEQIKEGIELKDILILHIQTPDIGEEPD